MRTTVDLDEDILRVAKDIARDRDESLGRVLSDLARRGLKPQTRTRREHGMISPCSRGCQGQNRLPPRW